MSMSDTGHTSLPARRPDAPEGPRRKPDMSPRHPLTRHRYGSSDSLDKIMAAHSRLNSSPSSRRKQLDEQDEEDEYDDEEESVHTPKHDGGGLPELGAVVEGTTLVETEFDEEVLKRLFEIDCGVPLLVDRIKQSMVSCKEASAFFKKRAQEEDEYGKSMQKLARSTMDSYNANGGKAGSFVNAWHRSMKMHETLGENRIRYAHRLKEMSDELANLAKEVDKNVRVTRELATKYERDVLAAEDTTEKQRHKVEGTAEDLQQLLAQKNSSDSEAFSSSRRIERRANALGKAVAKGGQLLKGRNAGYSERHEQDLRLRLASYSETYRRTFTQMQTIRREYFAHHLPRILRAFKESLDELDLGTQYHLSRYAFLYESVILSDATTLTPTEDDAEGLKPAMEAIDDRADFTSYMQNYAFAHGGANYKGARRDAAPVETRVETGYLANLPPYANGGTPSKSSFPPARATFGVDLSAQLIRDDVEVPSLVIKCCEAVERRGLDLQGVYRISGTSTKVQKLKELLDRDLESVDLDAEEWSSDISNITSVLKLWLRDLPEPVITFESHQAFLEAARVENDRLRCIRMHERVNELPDANYMTLKYLMGHLYKVVEHEAENSMSVQNVAIVFAPTLFGQLPPIANRESNGSSAVLDAGLQVKAIETILENYVDIFVDENEPQSLP